MAWLHSDMCEMRKTIEPGESSDPNVKSKPNETGAPVSKVKQSKELLLELMMKDNSSCYPSKRCEAPKNFCH